jgi:hypothetical protein
VALEGRPIHIPDVLADPEYQNIGYQQVFGYRTDLGVPPLRRRLRQAANLRNPPRRNSTMCVTAGRDACGRVLRICGAATARLM